MSIKIRRVVTIDGDVDCVTHEDHLKAVSGMLSEIGSLRHEAYLQYQNMESLKAENESMRAGGRNQACTVPPEGWKCSRSAGHDGPCAARPA